MNSLLDLDDNQINTISKALAHYVFRHGVVEDIHAEGKLSESDMKRLNKDVHNRIAGLLTAIRDNKMDRVMKTLGFLSLYGSDWDKCEPYLDEFDIW